MAIKKNIFGSYIFNSSDSWHFFRNNLDLFITFFSSFNTLILITGYGKVVAPVSSVVSHGYAAPAYATSGYAAPAYATASYAAPAYAAAAPAYAGLRKLFKF